MTQKSNGIEKVANKPTRPLVVYDGDCGFCVYWAHYWQKLTGDNVSYKPYQSVTAEYPEIPIKEFQRAVQYIETDGTVSSAAKASFLTLSHATAKGFWFWLYQKLPGFAFISEKVYAFIAAHRSSFYAISLFLWGPHHEPPRYNIVSWVYIRALALVFLIAFISFGSQALGLISHQGIIPISELINVVKQQVGIERYWYLPMVFWINSSDVAIQTTCWGGVLLSVLLFINIFPRLCLFGLFVLYLSLVNAGQIFMSFQWDLLLLEMSVIAFILVKYTTLGIWLLRWLLFRFLFASGLVKVFSGDIAWQDYSALYYHFLTQPLPTPIAWYAAQLPQTILIAGAMGTLIVEIILPFFIFLPRHLRFFAAFSFVIFQTIILLTGNYNFFNLEVIMLCIVLFDDAALRKILPAKLSLDLSNPKEKNTYHLVTSYLTYTLAGALVYISLVQFYVSFYDKYFPKPLLWIANSLSPLHMVNVYGPFAVMTKERMEIVIEGSADGSEWKEYDFKYKPGDVYRRPLWSFPFQPRVDWQMWFAALNSAEYNPWFTRFLQCLLENSPPVIALLERSPFPDSPPVYIRAQYYQYNFTNSEEKKATDAWWKRRYVSLYFPEAQLKK